MKPYLFLVSRKVEKLDHLRGGGETESAKVKSELADVLDDMVAADLFDSEKVVREVALTAFSLHPTEKRLEKLLYHGLTSAGRSSLLEKKVELSDAAARRRDRLKVFNEVSLAGDGDNGAPVLQLAVDGWSGVFDNGDEFVPRRVESPEADICCLNLAAVVDIHVISNYQIPCVHPEECDRVPVNGDPCSAQASNTR